jgi:hypothetical protein
VVDADSKTRRISLAEIGRIGHFQLGELPNNIAAFIKGTAPGPNGYYGMGGAPVDNGSQFTSREFDLWAYANGVILTSAGLVNPRTMPSSKASTLASALNA